MLVRHVCASVGLMLLIVMPSLAQPQPSGLPGQEQAGRADPNIRDQVELLEAQITIKKAQLIGLERKVAATQEMNALAQQAASNLSPIERLGHRLQAEQAKSDFEVAKAELGLLELRLRQWRRHAEENARPPQTPLLGQPPAAPPGQRDSPRSQGSTQPGLPGAPGAPGTDARPISPAPTNEPAGPGSNGAPAGPGRPRGGFTPLGDGGPDVRHRLEELEKKLDRLLEQFDRLRGDQPQPTRDGRPGADAGPRNTEERAKQFIARFDKNADGKLSADEYPSFMRPGFEAADTNKDGFVDAKELMEAFEKMRANFPGSPVPFPRSDDRGRSNSTPPKRDSDGAKPPPRDGEKPAS